MPDDGLSLAREAAMRCAGAVVSLVNAAHRGDDLTGAISHLDRAIKFADSHLRPNIDFIRAARTSSDPVTLNGYSAASFHELALSIAMRLFCIGFNASRRLSKGATPGRAPETRNAIKRSFKKGGLDINWLNAGISAEGAKAAAAGREPPALTRLRAEDRRVQEALDAEAKTIPDLLRRVEAMLADLRRRPVNDLGVRADAADEQLAWLRGERPGDFLLPAVGPLWANADKLGVKELPAFTDEPETACTTDAALEALAARLQPAAATPALDAADQTTVWYHGGRSYSLNGVSPVLVSNELHNVLKAFLDRNEALDTKTLEKAGVGNVTLAVDKIVKKFSGNAVRRPERKGDGYFIRVRTVTATN